MKKILLKSVTVVHPESSFNGKTVDVLLAGGLIQAIDKNIPVADKSVQEIEAKGKYLIPGLFDLNTNFGEPGFETKEDLESGSEAAAAGGFTGVALMPNTNPPVYSKAEVAYLVNKAAPYLTDVFPLGAISYKREGKDLAELYDMHLAGAVAFTDGNRPVADSGLMSRAMLYAKGFDGLVFSNPEDPSIAGSGKMNEGETSTYLGMKGIPALAEELMIARDIYLAEYNDCRIHISTVSTAKSVELIRQAKKRGLQVTCDVAAHHLVLTEDAVTNFDSNYKVKPPLRTKADVKALLKGLNDGTIDAVVSQHTPHEVEFKNIEFEIASYGIIALQTLLPLVLQAGLSMEQVIEKVAVNPRRILNLPVPEITVGATANLALVDPKAQWQYSAETNLSKSQNSPYLGNKLTGKVLLVCNNNQVKMY